MTAKELSVNDVFTYRSGKEHRARVVAKRERFLLIETDNRILKTIELNREVTDVSCHTSPEAAKQYLFN